jgi:hypothetical protein
MPPDGFVLLGQADPPAPPERAEEVDSDAADAWSDDTAPEGLPAEVLELGALLAALEPNRPEQVVLTLGGTVGGRLAARAAFLGMIAAPAAEAAAEERDWSVILELGLSASQLAVLVQAEPWLPPVRAGVPFYAWLVERGVLTASQAEELLDQSLQAGAPLFQVALEQGVLDEATYVAELAVFAGLELATAPAGVQRCSVVGFPFGWVEHFELVPLGETRGVQRVAFAAPLPDALLARLAADLGGPVQILLAAPSDVAAWRRRWLGRWWELHRPARG